VLELAAGMMMYVSSANYDVAGTDWLEVGSNDNKRSRTQSGALSYTGLDMSASSDSVLKNLAVSRGSRNMCGFLTLQNP